MSKLKKVILAALLLATTVVLSRFLSIKTPIIVISFSYLPIMLSAILLGPFYSTLIAALSDLIGALLFPFGAYFFGYTLSSAFAGLIYGLLLYKGKKEFSNKNFIIRLIVSTLLVIVVCNTLLNTLWIYITTKKALVAILPTRLLKQLIMLPIQVVSVFFVDLGLKKIYPNFFERENDEEDEQTQNDKNVNENEQKLENNLIKQNNSTKNKTNKNKVKKELTTNNEPSSNLLEKTTQQNVEKIENKKENDKRKSKNKQSVNKED
mgnify:FL=1